MHKLGIDLGGTKFHAILTKDEVTNVIYEERQETRQEEGYESLISRMCELIKRIKKDFAVKETSVGLGIPGVIDSTNRVSFSNATILQNHNVKQDMEAGLGQKVSVANDANCFALSEARYGAAKGEKIVLGVILGTGLGGGIVIDQKLHRGFNGVAGEWGHARFLRSGSKAWTGSIGEYEHYLSGTAAKRIYKEKYGIDMVFPEIVKNYRNGEPKASEFMNEYFEYFGKAMANLINFFDPNVLIFGGGLSNIDEIYKEGREHTKPYVFGDEFLTKFLPPKLGDYSGVFGAAALDTD